MLVYIEIEIKNTSTFSVVVITFPSGSQTYVVLPAQMPKVNVTTGCMHPIDDINRMRILHALFQAVGLIQVGWLGMGSVDLMFQVPYPTYNTRETGFEFYTHCFNDGLRLAAPASTGL